MGMQRAGESSGPTRADGAIAPLRGLLELSRLTRRQPTLLETLRAVAATVSEALGFGVVVINAYRPEGNEYEVVTVHGSEQARQILLGNVTQAVTWEPLLAERFRRHGVYFIPAGTLEHDEATVRWYTPDVPRAADATEQSWRADDALFATLEASGGGRYGIISVDAPASGLRPDDQQLELLGALAAHASLAIESARQMAALRSAAARNRAVIASTLDCVIAVDEHDRLIEFNPAAERTFRYRSHDVLGRDVAELLVPPDIRDAYRVNSAQVREDPAASLLDRRIETIAMRSDGTVFPVELTVTRVEGINGDGPLFYAFLRDIAERRRGEEQLAYLAYHDALTGLPNRILVEQQLDLALARARRADGAAALMFVDLDDFKEVNDRLGHGAGDRLLAAVATRLRGVLRDTDVLARQGGDEFLVLLSDLTDDPAAVAEKVAGKLLDALREPFVVSGTEVRTGASLGVSVYPDDASDTEALLRHADAAMYKAKAAGGGRLSFHQRSESLGSRRASIANQLRSAIANGEMELHYQPVWFLREAREMSGLEALLRWHHPERGLLGPDTFMNQADQSSAGDELMNWVTGECCRQAREWLDEGLAPIIGVNVSPRQLLATGFVSRFARQVERHGLAAVNFAIELTESAWSVDSTDSLEVIEDLRLFGFALALDDFGAGYSSLSRLVDLGFDVIKIDGGMLIDVPGDPVAVKLLLAVFELAAACDADIVAGGVETQAQVEFLTASGITQAQGPVLASPMTAAELTPLLRRQLVPGSPPGRSRPPTPNDTGRV
jgi:diguanylate cyclase (GGDEF)-like protein/PAS domain S-box-containing protein